MTPVTTTEHLKELIDLGRIDTRDITDTSAYVLYTDDTGREFERHYLKRQGKWTFENDLYGDLSAALGLDDESEALMLHMLDLRDGEPVSTPLLDEVAAKALADGLIESWCFDESDENPGLYYLDLGMWRENARPLTEAGRAEIGREDRAQREIVEAIELDGFRVEDVTNNGDNGHGATCVTYTLTRSTQS